MKKPEYIKFLNNIGFIVRIYKCDGHVFLNSDSDYVSYDDKKYLAEVSFKVRTINGVKWIEERAEYSTARRAILLATEKVIRKISELNLPAF